MNGGGQHARVSARSAIEWALRVLALASLALLLWRRWQPDGATSRDVDLARGAGVDAALARWTRASAAAPRAHAALDSLPSAAARDWMAALRRAGTPIGWSAERAPAVAVAASAAADPQGGVRLAVAAPGGARIAIGDEHGVLDTLRAAAAGAAAMLPDAGATVRARAEGAVAATPTPPAPRLGRVIVLGRAGWEAKFVVAALEERGWSVSARLPVAPGVVVSQGPMALDTARVSAVVALDSTAATDALVRPAAIARFVRDGGGLVLAGDAGALPAFRAIAAGAAGARVAPPLDGAAPPGDPFGALGVRPISALAAGAVPLARHAAGPLVGVAARRIGAGRVLQAGYDETWRVRMATDDDGPDRHRDWWARAVAAVAYAPPRGAADGDRAAGGARDPLDAAPLAHAVAALGAPTPVPTVSRAAVVSTSRLPDWIPFTIAMTALLAEWASRRRRGAR